MNTDLPPCDHQLEGVEFAQCAKCGMDVFEIGKLQSENRRLRSIIQELAPLKQQVNELTEKLQQATIKNHNTNEQ